MIKDLMGKLHVQDSIDEDPKQEQAAPAAPQAAAPSAPRAPASAPASAEKPSLPPIPRPAPPKRQNDRNEQSIGGEPMTTDGIIIDLGEGISLNVPIKKKMSLGEFLKVAEKVKALEMLSEEDLHRRY